MEALRTSISTKDDKRLVTININAKVLLMVEMYRAEMMNIKGKIMSRSEAVEELVLEGLKGTKLDSRFLRQ